MLVISTTAAAVISVGRLRVVDWAVSCVELRRQGTPWFMRPTSIAVPSIKVEIIVIVFVWCPIIINHHCKHVVIWRALRAVGL